MTRAKYLTLYQQGPHQAKSYCIRQNKANVIRYLRYSSIILGFVI